MTAATSSCVQLLVPSLHFFFLPLEEDVVPRLNEPALAIAVAVLLPQADIVCGAEETDWLGVLGNGGKG